MDSILSVYFLCEVINFKYVLNTMDYISKYKNGYWKRNVPWP